MSSVEHWPTAVDYRTALQTPSLCFNDPGLKQGTVLRDLLGLPLVATGNVVVVFRMRLAEGDVALRCFIRKVAEEAQARRYATLNAYRETKSLAALVPCIYRPAEIQVEDARYPVVQMPWVPGLQLHRFVEKNLRQPHILNALADQWRVLMRGLCAARFAHGDLADGNVLVDERGMIHLIDYDAAFVPPLRGQPPQEIGKANYQHPGRLKPDGPDYGYYAPNVDAFSALVIYLSLRALADEPERWPCYHTGENLVFDKDDFRDPGYTPIWVDLRSGQSDEVKRLADVLERFCQKSVADLPDLEEALQKHTPEQAAPPKPVMPRASDQAPKPPPRERPAPVEVHAAPEPEEQGVPKPWPRVYYLAGMGTVAVLVVLFFLLGHGLGSKVQIRADLLPPYGTMTAYLPPQDLPGFYTGYATSLEGAREPMALIIDSLVVDSTETNARFVYSVNWKAHYIRGLGRYTLSSGHVDLENHYVLYVARATADEVVLASLSQRDQRPLVMINKRTLR
jgi:hypothetical protein